MNTPIPSIDVCRHMTKGDFVLLHKIAYRENNVYLGNVTFGKMDRLATDELRRSGLQMVRESLQMFARRGFTRTPDSEFESLGRNGKKKFFNEHQIVGVSLRSNGDLWLDPVTHQKRGVCGSSDVAHRQVLERSASAEEFYYALLRAVEYAEQRSAR